MNEWTSLLAARKHTAKAFFFVSTSTPSTENDNTDLTVISPTSGKVATLILHSAPLSMMLFICCLFPLCFGGGGKDSHKSRRRNSGVNTHSFCWRGDWIRPAADCSAHWLMLPAALQCVVALESLATECQWDAEHGNNELDTLKWMHIRPWFRSGQSCNIGDQQLILMI